jgi:hypothetical protein
MMVGNRLGFGNVPWKWTLHPDVPTVQLLSYIAVRGCHLVIILHVAQTRQICKHFLLIDILLLIYIINFSWLQVSFHSLLLNIYSSIYSP